MASRSWRGEVKLAPRKAARLRMLNQHSIWFSHAYPFRITPLSTQDGGGYLIEFPDVPGCMSDGETPDEAIANGRDALKAFQRTVREFGDLLPEPGVFAVSSGQWRQRVPKSLHARLVSRAR
jgi:antitoxin HicB